MLAVGALRPVVVALEAPGVEDELQADANRASVAASAPIDPERARCTSRGFIELPSLGQFRPA
jgi:hypothetical protein